ncbi:aminotransferase class V-fold PLP-dependent enzyme [Clostridiaceae bacterium M8S5]|nr:aminotransferase class V-fold PLP-dependent enzyme [Clostridiaceae bacterium M8S5]
MIYLDNAATSFPKPERVYNTILQVMTKYGANPGRSGHKLAMKAGRGIYEAREIIADLFKVKDPMNIIFTHNATDSLNLGIKGILKEGDHVITTSMEHNSVLRPLMALKDKNIETTIVNCDNYGVLDIENIKDNIKRNTKMIITTHASNVVGSIMPIYDIAKIAKECGVLYMVDAAQTAGVYDIDVRKGIDILAFPGHKSLLGPQGTGGLYIRDGLDITQLKEGGTGSKSNELYQPIMLPDRYESGTPNAPGIIGLGEGVSFIKETGMENIRRHETELTEHFITELKKIKEVIIYGPKEHRAPVIPINIDNRDSSEVSFILDSMYGICTRPGLHCAPLAHKTIGTFEQGVVRFSLGFFNTHKEIDDTIKAIKSIINEF